jgi:hypothetical protein
MAKRAQLGDTLGRLSVEEAVALARTVELRRLRGQEELPTDLMLAALRAQLRAARAPRVPTLQRLVVAGFDIFLVDREAEPRAPGTIARAVLAPWWQALTDIAGADLAPLETALIDCVGAPDPAAREALARRAQAAAAGWTRTLAQELARGGGGRALVPLFPRPGLVADVGTIATVLALAEPLADAFVAIDRALAQGGHLDGRRIVEFAPEAVTVAKQRYLALSDMHGLDSVFLALGLLNRLSRPWEILRLGRALMWRADDTALRHTEFAAVGDRLIHDLADAARAIVALAAPHTGAPDCAAMVAAVTTYADGIDGLLGEFGFHRDGPWGEAILETRVAVCDALGGGFPERLAVHLLRCTAPGARSGAATRGIGAVGDPPEPEADVAAAAELDVAAAVMAAQLLLLLRHRGDRHGFGQRARETIDMIGTELGVRAEILLEALRRTPSSPAPAAQIAAAASVLDVFFADGRGATLLRRMGLVRQGGGAAA